MYKPISIISFLLFVTMNVFGQLKGDQVFDANILHEIRLYSIFEPNIYDVLVADAVDTSVDRPYHLVSMEFDGVVIDSIGIRAKGFSSASDLDQLPFKIDFNEYKDDQTFDGLKKINLNNSYYDPYRQKDRVSYELFRRAGIPAPRTSYAEVYLNDEFIEIYVIVQQIDKTFIKEHYADEGSLLKTYELIYGEDTFDENIFDVSEEEKIANLHTRNYFKFLLVNILVGAATDNYPDNNFYTYYSEKEDIYRILPWDYNFSFNDYTQIYEDTPGASTIWANPSYKNMYLQIACELSQYLLDVEYTDSLLLANQNLILSNSQGATVDDLYQLNYLLGINRQSFLNSLVEEGFDCQDFSCPVEIGDLVINEFVAYSDSLGGIQEPNGGTPDWIELFNNTSEEIILDHHYYLSDDDDFPKKWTFENPVTIPPNGYQIIWADRDIHQEGIHSNFKIDKLKGALLLSYEDLTILDRVEYQEQELNKAYARIPNGIGDFMIRDMTFNNSNDLINSSSEIKDEENIYIYPNPATNVINVNTSDLIVKMTIYDTSGNLIKEQTNEKTNIDITDISCGLFILKVITDKKSWNNVFIKL